MQETIDIKKYSSFVKTNSFVKKTGKISRIIGLMIESNGPGVAIGSICTIHSRNRSSVQAQVVGFRDNQTLLMQPGSIPKISPRCMSNV
jgi:flagellum-specific ATP synthase